MSFSFSSNSASSQLEIAKSFLEDHINTVHELESIKKQMYQQVVLADKPADKVMILSLGKIFLIEDSSKVDIKMVKEGYRI